MTKKKQEPARTEQVREAVDAERVEDRTSGTYYTPLIDIHETDEAIVVEADMPGVDRSGVEVKIDKGILTIVGHVTRKPVAEDVTQLYEEFIPGDFYRAFSLGEDIDEEKVSGGINDGVLTVTLPKGRKSRIRRIEVKG
jgi:HSP20 family protein